MRKKVYLHIGHGRTGTTTIQKALADNCQKGIFLYPKAIAADPHGASHRLAFAKASDSPDIYSPDEKEHRDMHTSLLREVEESSCEKVFMSSEVALPALFNAPFPFKPGVLEAKQELFQELILRYEFFVIYYVREPFEQIQSMFNQYSESRSLAPSQENFNSHVRSGVPPYFQLLYHENLEAWKNVVGKERILTKVYDKKFLTEGDVVVDFFNFIGEKDLLKKMTIDKTKQNASEKKDFVYTKEDRETIVNFLKEDNELYASKWLPEEQAKALLVNLKHE